jgi:hypothetical protein
MGGLGADSEPASRGLGAKPRLCIGGAHDEPTDPLDDPATCLLVLDLWTALLA